MSFHKHAQDSRPRRRELGWVVHAVRGDATNAKIGDAKAHVTEVRSLFHHVDRPDHVGDAVLGPLEQKDYYSYYSHCY